MAVIDYNDVAAAIGRPISKEDEQTQVDLWIEDVELILTARLGDLSTLDENLLIYVVREAVIARMRHRSETAEAGEDESSYFLRVLDPWWALLDPTDTGSGAFSVRPYFEADNVNPLESWA